MTNRGLYDAKRNKKDCFFTTYEDAEKELRYYEGKFKGRTVYCNCDSEESVFWKYFRKNFRLLGLKRLVCTHWSEDGKSYKAEFDGKKEARTPLQGDGDFRSEECIELLKEADVVVTNPPFSIFNEFMKTMLRYNKQFIIMGPMTQMKSKTLFPLFMSGELRYGPSIKGGDRKFYVPDDYPLEAYGCGIDKEGRRFIRVKGVRWFTNLDHGVRNSPLVLTESYDPKRFPKFDNLDAVSVLKTAEIPKDYDGVMGVPISYMDKYCPSQFDILGVCGKPVLNGQAKFSRILIRKKAG